MLLINSFIEINEICPVIKRISPFWYGIIRFGHSSGGSGGILGRSNQFMRQRHSSDIKPLEPGGFTPICMTSHALITHTGAQSAPPPIILS